MLSTSAIDIPGGTTTYASKRKQQSKLGGMLRAVTPMAAMLARAAKPMLATACHML